jgi:hypothetical protein
MNYLTKLYIKALPLMTIYSTLVGISIGIEANGIETNRIETSRIIETNNKKKTENSLHTYSTLIGYTGLGIITGITYPISFPLCSSYVLYKNHI